MNKTYTFEDNKMYCNNGNFIFCFSCELPEKYTLSESDYIALNDLWEKVIKDMPFGTIVYKQDVFLKKELNPYYLPSGNYLLDKDKEHFSNTPYLEHKCLLFFILPSTITINDSLVNPFKSVNFKTFEAHDKKIITFINDISQIVNFINSTSFGGGQKIKISPLDNYTMENYELLYFNNFDLTSQSDRIVNDDYIQVNNKKVAVLSVLSENKFPDVLKPYKRDDDISNDQFTFFNNYGESLGFNLDFSHSYNQIIFCDNSKSHIENLTKTNDQLLKSSSFDKQNKFNAEVTSNILEDIIKNEVRIVRGHFNLVIYASTYEELENFKLTASTAYKQLDIIPYAPIDNYLNAIYHYSFPAFCTNFKLNQTFLSDIKLCCALINNTSDFKGDKSGVVLNSRLYNKPVIVDNWDEKKIYINARNFIIFAPTGGGKSFTMNHIVSSDLYNGIKNVIIDLGGSYKKLALLFPNDTIYITYESGKSLGVNPFYLFDELTTEKLEDLVDFVGVHYKREGNLSEEEKTSLRIILKYFYSTKKVHSLPLFVDFVKNISLDNLGINNKFFDLDNFLHLMSEFVEDGSYAFLYKIDDNNLSSNIMDKKIIVFELDQAKDNPLLLTVMLQLVNTTIKEVIWKDKSTKGRVTFDEVAEQLKWNGVLGRIQYMYQAIRKQNGSVGMILQAESQLPDNNLSNSIIENTQLIYVLGAKNYKKIQNRFSLTEQAYMQMCSIQPNFKTKRPYAEIFIQRGLTHQVYRLEVSKSSFWAYQTEGAENQKLVNRAIELNSLENAIAELIN